MYNTIASIRIALPDTLIRGHFAKALHPFADPHSGAVDPASETHADHTPESGASSTHPHRPEDLARTTEAHPYQPFCPEVLLPKSGASSPHLFSDPHSGAVDPASETRADHTPESGASSTHPHRPEDLARTTEAHPSQPFCPEVPLPESGASSPHLSQTADLVLASAAQIPILPDFRELHRFDFADADAECRFGRDAAGWLLEMTPRNGSASARFRMAPGSESSSTYFRAASGPAQALTDITPAHNPALLRFGVWTLFNLAALRRGAVALHASAIRFRERGVLFLGESGTGKSTHTRLWREHISGTVLLNDDSPIIRAADDEARVYGSPWSGKTPCYRNESCPIAAFVRLSQAPHNRIRRLRPIEAIGALLASAPPAFVRNEELSDALCSVLSRVIAQVPVYRLECRPDADAARLASRTIFNDTTL